jgi:hypothetical protein
MSTATDVFVCVCVHSLYIRAVLRTCAVLNETVPSSREGGDVCD